MSEDNELNMWWNRICGAFSGSLKNSETPFDSEMQESFADVDMLTRLKRHLFFGPDKSPDYAGSTQARENARAAATRELINPIPLQNITVFHLMCIANFLDSELQKNFYLAFPELEADMYKTMFSEAMSSYNEIIDNKIKQYSKMNK